MSSTPEESGFVARACRELISDHPEKARLELASLSGEWDTQPRKARTPTPEESTRVFLRDGFIDRYTGDRLVYPPLLRPVSLLLPEEFPYHPNWKRGKGHPAYWRLSATIDHVQPVTRGGADSEENWISTSMLMNMRKGNHTLADLGWELHQPGSPDDWDGLIGEYLTLLELRPQLVDKSNFKAWRHVAMRALDATK